MVARGGLTDEQRDRAIAYLNEGESIERVFRRIDRWERRRRRK
jgi:hypothetical protein